MCLLLQGTKINKNMDEDVTEITVNNIFKQLQECSGFDNASHAQTREQVTSENLEQFVIERAGELINTSLNILDDYNSILKTAPSEKGAEAVANLIASASNAIETLNRVLNNNKKLKNAVKLKEMDIQSRSENNKRDNATKIMITRGEAIKLLEDAAKEIERERAIEATSIDVTEDRQADHSHNEEAE